MALQTITATITYDDAGPNGSKVFVSCKIGNKHVTLRQIQKRLEDVVDTEAIGGGKAKGTPKAEPVGELPLP